jgi:dihydrofolate reductase
MNLIVAVSAEWGIGYKNELLFRIREDLQRFRELTTGKVVVMGHNTYKSLPANRQPFPNRTNIVLSRSTEVPGVITCASLPALFEQLKNYVPQDIFVIGGEKIYTQLLNFCRTAYITKVEAAPPADVHMPNIDEMTNWQIHEQSSPKTSGSLSYKYVTYHNDFPER